MRDVPVLSKAAIRKIIFLLRGGGGLLGLAPNMYYVLRECGGGCESVIIVFISHLHLRSSPTTVL
jgi:hypothetical protein